MKGERNDRRGPGNHILVRTFIWGGALLCGSFFRNERDISVFFGLAFIMLTLTIFAASRVFKPDLEPSVKAQLASVLFPSRREPMKALEAFAWSKHADRKTATLLLALAAGLCLIIMFNRGRVLLPIVLCFTGAVAALDLGQLALDYRLSRALYGTTEYEARELVSFIIRNSSHIDLSDGLGGGGIEEERANEVVLAVDWEVSGT